MTEFGPGVFALAQEDAVRKAGSIGRPNFFVDARIVDEENVPVEPGTVGELVLRGPSMCSGYFNDAEASAEGIDTGGWFHTGDLAVMDEQHYFTIVDRKKDLFISGGETSTRPRSKTCCTSTQRSKCARWWVYRTKNGAKSARCSWSPKRA